MAAIPLKTGFFSEKGYYVLTINDLERSMAAVGFHPWRKQEGRNSLP